MHSYGFVHLHRFCRDDVHIVLLMMTSIKYHILCAQGKGDKKCTLEKVSEVNSQKKRASGLKEASAPKSSITHSQDKARNKRTKILWIFIGIHAANVILMIDKIKNRMVKAA